MTAGVINILSDIAEQNSRIGNIRAFGKCSCLRIKLAVQNYNLIFYRLKRFFCVGSFKYFTDCEKWQTCLHLSLIFSKCYCRYCEILGLCWQSMTFQLYFLAFKIIVLAEKFTIYLVINICCFRLVFLVEFLDELMLEFSCSFKRV